ncbi:MAG: methionyl-tRNA formyltransferase [Bernardetiaceae bacterium]|jgi:methionyl-tRNA formyltransferase|nr:methionyl-tRNA formyltransferase [Bernardetiaceae bacterium]
MAKPLRIVYLGTPEFAVPPLQRLAQVGYQVVGVVTAPDRTAGRGLQLQPSAVKVAAEALNIPVLQPEKLKNPEFLAQLRALEADLQIIVAFRMLPEAVWAMPRLGTFNLHASLLPQYRGAAPINWAIINGETQTGLTTFFLQHEIDTGDLLMQEPEPIYPTDNAGTLYQRLMQKGADLVLRTVQAIEQEQVTPLPQPTLPPDRLKTAPKIFRETCQLDFSRPALALANQIRGLAPAPSAWAVLNGKVFKIHQGRAETQTTYPPAQWGQPLTDQKTYLHLPTPLGHLAVLELQAEGKKRMPIGEFLRGQRI